MISERLEMNAMVSAIAQGYFFKRYFQVIEMGEGIWQNTETP